MEKLLYYENIAYLCKVKGMKYNELETKIGVAAGYISRSKESNSKPGTEVALKVADCLGVSLDALLTVPMGELSSTEIYLLDFIKKLEEQTYADKIDWKQKTPPERHRTDFISHTYERETVIPDVFYEAKINNGAIIKIMYIAKVAGQRIVKNSECVEIWMSVNGVQEYVCSTVKNPDLEQATRALMSAIVIMLSKPHVSENVKNSIDMFMES